MREARDVLDGEKILITGATGKLGFPIARALAGLNEVWGAARLQHPEARDKLTAAGVKPLSLDISSGDLSTLPTDFTYVFHAAVDSGLGEWAQCVETNAQRSGTPAPRVIAGVPVALCADIDVDRARAYAGEVLGHADFSPNYVRLLEHGDAADVGDTMAAGDESAVLTRLRRYRDAGVTDLAARIVPLGDDATTRLKSRQRTQEFLASIASNV